jgi:membrane-associated phospholipid phosphatase
MIDFLLQLDYFIFQLINQVFTNSFFDWVMPLLRNKYFWVPVYVFFFAFFVVNFKWKGIAIIAFTLLTLVLSDQISASVIKPLVNRTRPCGDQHFKETTRILVQCGSGKSFPSSHATNHFAFSFFLIMMFHRSIKWILPFALIWAFSVSYAQVYVGVHFPLDIIGGAILGIIIGVWIGIFARQILKLSS